MLYSFNFILIIIGIFCPSGEPILLHLFRYRALAVDDHSCLSCALCRPNLPQQQPRLMSNAG
ncbi:MAG: hypothetical protein DRJ06_05205 [Candidatus Aminicenantes bacterium]|nr:MAG: hypothetical protein DRJ06_05205 [Candidatus Aminicenantes bacterium]